MPVGAAIALGALGAGALTRAVGGAIQAKGLYSDEDERRRSELEQRRREGSLGLSGSERAAMEARSTVQQGAALRDAQAQAVQIPVSSRELFLQSLGSQTAIAEARQAAARDVNEADRLEAEAQRAELSALSAKQAQSKAGVRSALLGGVADAASIGGTFAMGQFERQQEAELEAAAAKRRLEGELSIAQAGASLYGGSVKPMSGYSGRYGLGNFYSNAPAAWR